MREQRGQDTRNDQEQEQRKKEQAGDVQGKELLLREWLYARDTGTNDMADLLQRLT